MYRAVQVRMDASAQDAERFVAALSRVAPVDDWGVERENGSVALTIRFTRHVEQDRLHRAAQQAGLTITHLEAIDRVP